MKLRLHLLILLTALFAPSIFAQSSDWVRPAKAGDPLIWGRKDGIVFGLPSPGGMPGPRGLIRIGTIDRSTGEANLLNFVAVEPATKGKKLRGDRMGFSELEKSKLDHGMNGARLWVSASSSADMAASQQVQNVSGTIETKHEDGHDVEILSVRVEIERFTQNGAHVYLLLSIRSDHPDEVRFAAYPYSDSKPLDEVVFTATMGAYERLRLLWLKNRVVDSRKLYDPYAGYDFAEKDTYPLQEMLRDSQGNPIALCTSSERTPSQSRNPDAKANWYYAGPRITQYWTIPAKDIAPNLRVRVNGRHTYWQSKNEIPGGTTFENFELREQFSPGQTFIFGVSQNEPFAWKPALTDLGPEAHLE
ncbi:hypothetical protein [Acidicapsa ligni]|uniref:hypothetical protein n=1 Tax=Acidicapsa ligni TaxID=542300 RepID=UPI0021DF9E91|nr:hypothetical protein [Acidicapsa ligni]